ncbi:MAG: hypothetical protein GAK30_02998 [Paracidovorax wautersii]|uniref:Type IV pilus assembly protein PilE n=1 Tax=Paracidovorax wautersii TaxID=1177982 RepID=A0A7V8FLX5_9BURK|nr:MAG: hypothetical protein GAK30_02998 [Paracidovorax wautersii]
MPLPTTSSVVRGFSLIEMLVALGIVALLAALAYPPYQDALRKGRRADARMALMTLMQQQERHAMQFQTYLGFEAGATDVPFQTHTGSGHAQNAPYWLAAAACMADGTALPLSDCVELQAHPQRADDDVGTLTYDSRGQQGCSGRRPALCWP